jgi:hypothetical protein
MEEDSQWTLFKTFYHDSKYYSLVEGYDSKYYSLVKANRRTSYDSI